MANVLHYGPKNITQTVSAEYMLYFNLMFWMILVNKQSADN